MDEVIAVVRRGQDAAESRRRRSGTMTPPV
jgi:hypothetical protein